MADLLEQAVAQVLCQVYLEALGKYQCDYPDCDCLAVQDISDGTRAILDRITLPATEGGMGLKITEEPHNVFYQAHFNAVPRYPGAKDG